MTNFKIQKSTNAYIVEDGGSIVNGGCGMTVVYLCSFL
jgi:hypothetical protein